MPCPSKEILKTGFFAKYQKLVDTIRLRIGVFAISNSSRSRSELFKINICYRSDVLIAKNSIDLCDHWYHSRTRVLPELPIMCFVGNR